MIDWVKKALFGEHEDYEFSYTDLELTWMKIGAANERRECAKICEEMDEFTASDEEHDALWNAANKIRMRSNAK